MSEAIQVTGMAELQQKLDYETLMQPSVEKAVSGIAAALSKQSGVGLGVQRNEVTAAVQSVGAQVSSTLIWPRTTGEAWARRVEEDFASEAPAQLAEAGKEIQQRWAS